MNFIKKSMLLLCVSFAGFDLFSAETDLSAQNSFLGEYVSSVWTSSDGLPGNTVTDLIQNIDGYMYIGTYDGLVRFDGVEFKIINHVADEKYAFTSARSIFEGNNGDIWVGSNDEGIIRISKDGTVYSYTVTEGLPNNSVRSIAEDKNGNIWVGTASGIAYITSEGNIVRPEGLSEYDENMMVLQLYCDTAGRIWTTCAKVNGLYCFSDGRFQHYRGFESIKDATVYCVCQDKKGGFWFGVGPHYAVYVSGSEETVYDIGFGTQPGTVVNSIYPDSKGGIWFARDTGITVLRNGQMLYGNQESGLTDNNVNKILEDREGNMWFGTDRGGLEKLSLGKFNTIKMTSAVNAICDDPARKVAWIGTDRGLYCYNPTTGKFEDNGFTEHCKNIRIRHVGLSSDGSVLVSTYEKLGQLKMSEKEGVKAWTEDDGLSGNRIRVCIESSEGKFYIGTTNGLNIVDPKSGDIIIINRDSGIPNDYIMCIFEDSDKTVWCGTDGGGIFSVKNGVLDKCFNKNDGLAGDVVFKIQTLDKKDEMWISTGTGISRFKDGKFTTLGTNSGLVTDSIFQMIYDYTGTVWVTNNRGINSMKMVDLNDFVSGEIGYIDTKYFGRSDGLNSNGVTSTSLSMKDSLGRVWFTLTDGFAIYDPVKVTNKSIPNVQLENFSFGTEVFDYCGQTVVVDPDVKRLSIKYTGLSFISPEQIQFRYKLAGFEDDFSLWTKNREVSYTNLKPGTYKFTVQAQNSDEIIGEILSPMVIIKKPYIWQLWWFWFLIVIVCLAIACLIVFTRYKELRIYQKKLEAEVESQTKELHLQTIELQKQAESLEIANHNLEKANQKSEKLLLNILPKNIAHELTEKPGEIIAKKYSNVSVLFADIVDFTKLSDGLTAEEIVSILNTVFTKFDNQVSLCGVEKIKTIGDSYMAAVGIDGENSAENSKKMVQLAIRFFDELKSFNSSNPIKLRMRIGINTGNLVAGVIGKTKFIYDIWGDTVNVASRMESTGMPGKIHVTESVFESTRDSFNYGTPMEMQVKGKGTMKTYFIEVLHDEQV